MNATLAAAPATATKRKCANCSKRAVYRIANAFQSSANGKAVCGSNSCFGALTGGYPAEGKRLS